MTALTCPCCFARFDIEAALLDEAARNAVKIALKFPAPLGDLILRYIALFRPVKRGLSWQRATKLLYDLYEPINAGRIERNGRVWAAPHNHWCIALEQMIENRDKLKLPLKTHGYLFEIIAGLASKSEGKSEKGEQEQKSYRYHRDTDQHQAPENVNEVVNRIGLKEGAQQLRDAMNK